MTGNQEKFRASLRLGREQGNIVRVYREGLEGSDAWADGFVIDVGRELFVLEVVDQDIKRNGVNVMRIKDISKLDVPTKYEAFQKRVLELRQDESNNAIKQINLTNWQTAVRTMGELFDLISIAEEEDYPDSVDIGKLIETTNEFCTLRTIKPSGEWDDEYEYDYSGITRVDAGGRYEQALMLYAQANS